MLGPSAVADLLAEASLRSGVVPVNARRCAMGELSARIVEACAEPMRFSVICRAVQRDKRQINTVLQRLIARGAVTRQRRGVYIATGAR